MNKPQQPKEVFNNCAVEYQEKFMNINKYKDSIDLFCSLLPKNAEVLEIACGPGNITQYITNNLPGVQILGLDIAPNMIALAKQNNPTARFIEMDCRNIEAINKQFDGIICGFCLPYLTKEETIKLISDCTNLLKSKGILYLSTIEGEYESSGIKSSSSGELHLYIHYYSSKFILGTLENNEHSILHHEIITELSSEDGTGNELIIVARKKDV